MAASFFISQNRIGMILLATASLVAGLGTAHANTHEANNLLEMPLEKLLNLEVSTASKFSQASVDAPSFVTVVTASDIKVFGWRTLADILASMPGLYVSSDSNYSYLGGRGFARAGDYNTRFLLLVDGVRSNDGLYDQASIGREFIVDVNLIDRVEYVPGSSSSIYGSNAFFGVINVITKNANQVPRPHGAIEIGSEGERKASARMSIRDENGAQLLLAATTFRRKGEDQYYPEFNTPGNNAGVAQGLDYERGGNVFVKGSMGPFAFSLMHNERERGIPTASYEQTFNDPRSGTKDTQTIASLAYQTELDSQTTVLARLSWGQQEYAGRYAYSAPDLLNVEGSKSAWAGTELSLLTSRWRNHKVLAGLEFQRDYKRDQFGEEEYPGGSLDAPTFSNDVQRFPLMNARHPGSRAGVYLQDEIALRENLLANVGVRYDHNSESSGAISPRVALIYKMTPATTFKAILGSAFRAPNGYELFYNTPGAGGQKANRDLTAERIRSRELILEQQLPDNSRLVVSAFLNKISNLISLTKDPADNLLVFRNSEGATGKGLEVQYEKNWAQGAKIRASQSWQKTSDNATGERAANSPLSLSKLNLSLPFWHNKVTAGLEARYTGARKTLAGSMEGFWVANATVLSAQLFDQVELSFIIYNLFNKHYADPGAQEHVQDAIPQPGRSYRLTASRSF